MAIVVVVALFLVWQFWPAGGKGTVATGPSKPGKGNGGGQGNGSGHVGVIVPGQNPIKHVIFIVKENRTFDHYFGTYPGADGATEGGTLECTDSGCVPGPDVPLKPAPYIQPARHHARLLVGAVRDQRRRDERVQHHRLRARTSRATCSTRRKTLPNYWAYADRFVLADRFFTSMYGPTFPEHLYTVAAQSYGIVDNKTNADTTGNYCDDPLEYTKRFPMSELSGDDMSRIMRLEEGITKQIPDQLYRIANYWEDTRTCINIKVLPDELEAAGISWKYYARPDVWMNGLQSIRHVRFGPMWNKVRGSRRVHR